MAALPIQKKPNDDVSKIMQNLIMEDVARSKIQKDLGDQYLILNKIGKGAFGTVWKIQDKKDGKFYAVKQVVIKNDLFAPGTDEDTDEKKEYDNDYENNEITILKQLSDHCSLDTPYLCYHDSKKIGNIIYIIMEDLSSWVDFFDFLFENKAENKHLPRLILKYNEIMNSYPVDVAKSNIYLQMAKDELDFRMHLICQIIHIIQQLHTDKHIAHRDIKPENFLYDPATQRLKLVDFGFSCSETTPKCEYSMKGTPKYIAPEILYRDYGLVYNFDTMRKSDLWSLAATIDAILYDAYRDYPYWKSNENDNRDTVIYRKRHEYISNFIYMFYPEVLDLIEHLKKVRSFGEYANKLCQLKRKL